MQSTGSVQVLPERSEMDLWLDFKLAETLLNE